MKYKSIIKILKDKQNDYDIKITKVKSWLKDSRFKYG
jgi:hypothetical protein